MISGGISTTNDLGRLSNTCLQARDLGQVELETELTAIKD